VAVRQWRLLRNIDQRINWARWVGYWEECLAWNEGCGVLFHAFCYWSPSWGEIGDVRVWYCWTLCGRVTLRYVTFWLNIQGHLWGFQPESILSYWNSKSVIYQRGKKQNSIPFNTNFRPINLPYPPSQYHIPNWVRAMLRLEMPRRVLATGTPWFALSWGTILNACRVWLVICGLRKGWWSV
jgi:hypothetical protein